MPTTSLRVPYENNICSFSDNETHYDKARFVNLINWYRIV